MDLLPQMGTQTVVKQLRPYEVALATCDGSRFIDEQLDSLASQTLPAQRLVVVDDASRDDTPARIQCWADRCDMPLLLLPRQERQGSLASFGQALAATEAEYVVLCDQDDRWDGDKVERLLRRMERLEERHGQAVPLLVHGDLRLMDAAGTVWKASFRSFQNLDPSRQGLLDLALQNSVTGCATLVNRACIEAALPFPADAILHDWWLGMVAAGLGALDYEPRALLSYRQHDNNVVGADGFCRQMVRRLGELPRVGASGDLVAPAITQLQAYLERYGSRLTQREPPQLVEQVRELSSAAPATRLGAALRLGLRKQGWQRTLGFYLCLLLWQRRSPATPS